MNKEIKECKFEDLLGKTISAVLVGTVKTYTELEIEVEHFESNGISGDERIIFKTYCPEINAHKDYVLHHNQDCCERVYIESIDGDLKDIIKAECTMAEEVIKKKDDDLSKYDHSSTYTFYKLGTAKGSVTIRWYGESNGYYSESVDFGMIINPGKNDE